MLAEEAVQEARVQRGRVPLVDRDLARAEPLDQARDEVEDLLLPLARDGVRELGAEELWGGEDGREGVVSHECAIVDGERRAGRTLSRKAEAKDAKTKWPSGDVRMYPVGISESTRVTMTAFADSKHCAFAVGQRARDAKRERRKCGACLLQEELVLGLEPAPERLLEAEGVHDKPRVPSKAAQRDMLSARDTRARHHRKHIQGQQLSAELERRIWDLGQWHTPELQS